jgi:DNA repair protein RadC
MMTVRTAKQYVDDFNHGNGRTGTEGVEGHRHRLRERFRKAYADGLHDYEMLELLLSYAIPRKDVKPIAKNLIERFGGLNGTLDADPAEIERIPEMGAASATLIKLVKEMGGLYLSRRMEKRDLMTSPQRVIQFAMMKLAGLPHEAFMAIFLNVQNELIDHAVVNEGTVDQVAVYPRRIVEMALSCHAAGLIVVHNHPSGYTDPSEEDKRLTRALADAARFLDIRLLDHIVVGRHGHFSFAERGHV